MSAVPEFRDPPRSLYAVSGYIDHEWRHFYVVAATGDSARRCVLKHCPGMRCTGVDVFSKIDFVSHEDLQ
jgi:hypothetical protein